MISHSPDALRRYTSKGAVLDSGRLTFLDTIEEAIELHYRNQTGG